MSDLKKFSREYRQEMYKRFPEISKAHHEVSKALKNGTLKRKPCEKCGKLKSEGHHRDYSKPLEIEWLCRSCHRKEHNYGTKVR